jgi:hypothetical protein
MSYSNNGFRLPLRTSPNGRSSRSSTDYDLEELSPRPSSPLITPERARDFDRRPYRDANSSRDRKGKGKGKAVAYADREAFPPMSVVDRMRLYREGRAAEKQRDTQGREEWERRRGPSWKPPSPSDLRHGDIDAEILRDMDYTPQQSFVESVFLGRANPAREQALTDLDTTFRTMALREQQIHNELQRLLNAQSSAIERGANGGSDRGTDSDSLTPRPGSPRQQHKSDIRNADALKPTVIPVRQPKNKPPSLRHVRNSITRMVAMLADLKAEEDAYVSSTLSARKAALVKANKLSTKHKAIVSELHSMEENDDDPLRREIDSMQGEYERVCGDIQDFEEKLRDLKRAKAQLQRRMEEARSERESGLSGYQGALRETERSIGEMMSRPGIKILDLAGLADLDFQDQKDAVDDAREKAGTGDNTRDEQLMERRLSGREFMRLRPERRTLAMAMEWWEGEVALLRRRKEAVDRERAALEEGCEVWVDVVQRILDYEARLAGALKQSMAASTSILSPSSERERQEVALFKQQYGDLRQTLDGLRQSMIYVEQKGWNLLVAAIGAELEGFTEGERILRTMMQTKGIEIGEDFGPLESQHGDNLLKTATDGLIGERGHQGENDSGSGQQDTVEELTGSVVRRWSGHPESPETVNNQGPLNEHSKDSSPDEPHEESDNEVPHGLLTADTHTDESENEQHNEVPAEFLSMHGGPMEKDSIDSQDSNEVPGDLMNESHLV